MRVVVPIAIIAGSLLVTAGIVTALVFFISGLKNRSSSNDAVPTELVTEPVTEAPEATETETHETPEATAAPTAAPTATPLASELAEESVAPSHDPERVTDALSSAYYEIEISKGRVKMQCLFSFVNNTDAVFYSGSFDVGCLNAVTATCGGIPARFYYDENGLLVIPFVDELSTGESCTLYFELEGAIDEEAGLALPALGYDTTYLISASIDSDSALTADGASLKLRSVDSAYHYTIDKKTVRSVTIRPVS